MLTLDRVFASLPRTERGKAIVIGADPKGETFLYTNGNSVYIRDVKEPHSVCDIYTQHSTATTVAKYSPSRFYIASGDSAGKLRIWDTTQQEHVLKNEFHVLGGPIRDVAWTGDSQRLIVGGEGREKFGVAILADTGASVGDINGHSKTINAVDVRRERPFRAVTASEDFLTCFFEGPPFKFKKQNEEHTNFVNCVRFSPDGQLFASASSSGRICLYEGKTSELLGQLGDPAHKGGVYSVAFSNDSARLLSVSGDKTARLWSVADRQLLGEWQFGKSVGDMQVSCVFVADTAITVSLDGSINFLDVGQFGEPSLVLRGHSKPITALGRSSDAAHLVSGSTDASLVVWESATGRMRRVEGVGHKNQIQALAVDAAGRIYSAAIDDTFLVSDLHTAQCQESVRQLPSQPADMCAEAEVVAVACRQHVVLLRSGVEFATLAAAGELRCCSLSPDAGVLAVGTSDTKSVLVYELAAGGAELRRTIADRQSEVTALAFSPDGASLAVAYADRYVRVYSVANDYQLAVGDDWCFHTAKVNCLAWADDSQRLASGSLDCSIIVWSLASPKKRITAKNAHPMSQITKLAWIDSSQLVSAGQDANIKVWRVSDS